MKIVAQMHHLTQISLKQFYAILMDMFGASRFSSRSPRKNKNSMQHIAKGVGNKCKKNAEENGSGGLATAQPYFAQKKKSGFRPDARNFCVKICCFERTHMYKSKRSN